MQVGAEFVVMVETTITANGKTIVNPIIRVTKSGSGNPSFVYFIDNQTVGQPRHWYVGDGNGNVVVSDVDVVDSTTSTALATALTNKLTAAGFLSGTHTGTVNDVPATYNRRTDLTIPLVTGVPLPDISAYSYDELNGRGWFVLNLVCFTSEEFKGWSIVRIDGTTATLVMCSGNLEEGSYLAVLGNVSGLTSIACSGVLPGEQGSLIGWANDVFGGFDEETSEIVDASTIRVLGFYEY